MAVSVKAFSAILTIVGSCTSLPLFLGKTSNVEVVTQVVTQNQNYKIETISKKLPENISVKEKGNCSIEELSQDSQGFLLAQERGGNFYIEILCENTNEDTSKGSLPPYWTGLFPEQVLLDSSSLAIGKKFVVKTETISSDDNSITTFKSSVLKTSIEGIWGEGLKTGEEHTAITISLSETSRTINPIYLITY